MGYEELALIYSGFSQNLYLSTWKIHYICLHWIFSKVGFHHCAFNQRLPISSGCPHLSSLQTSQPSEPIISPWGVGFILFPFSFFTYLDHTCVGWFEILTDTKVSFMFFDKLKLSIRQFAASEMKQIPQKQVDPYPRKHSNIEPLWQTSPVLSAFIPTCGQTSILGSIHLLFHRDLKW